MSALSGWVFRLILLLSLLKANKKGRKVRDADRREKSSDLHRILEGCDRLRRPPTVAFKNVDPKDPGEELGAFVALSSSFPFILACAGDLCSETEPGRLPPIAETIHGSYGLSFE